MKIERPNAKATTDEERVQLEVLRQRIRYSLTNGKMTRNEIEDVWRLILADGKVSVEELHIWRETTREITGDTALPQDWW